MSVAAPSNLRMSERHEALSLPNFNAGERTGLRLSRREIQVLCLLVHGCSNREMARRMTVSPDTVKYHVKNLYEKLGTRCRAGAVLAALNSGLLSADGVLAAGGHPDPRVPPPQSMSSTTLPHALPLSTS